MRPLCTYETAEANKLKTGTKAAFGVGIAVLIATLLFSCVSYTRQQKAVQERIDSNARNLAAQRQIDQLRARLQSEEIARQRAESQLSQTRTIPTPPPVIRQPPQQDVSQQAVSQQEGARNYQNPPVAPPQYETRPPIVAPQPQYPPNERHIVGMTRGGTVPSSIPPPGVSNEQWANMQQNARQQPITSDQATALRQWRNHGFQRRIYGGR